MPFSLITYVTIIRKVANEVNVIPELPFRTSRDVQSIYCTATLLLVCVS